MGLGGGGDEILKAGLGRMVQRLRNLAGLLEAGTDRRPCAHLRQKWAKKNLHSSILLVELENSKNLVTAGSRLHVQASLFSKHFIPLAGRKVLLSVTEQGKRNEKI
ncbi:hypothetical protein Celaphus_00014308 [Cervus elaphus hippelaphus]|uniref:Uncharacterized protein n=1 Tax=Cervus elaphus hippelaphus TaxID=46360 RepID=A0A212D544_CEREH|nr:hypothetical protein Celaphus_00014308 [Cervus elaphus hippelaphus]